jgi:hydroxypyruvate isomerase
MGHVLPYAANCTLLFTEVELLERPAAAQAAGLDAIEFWWPWPDQPVPPDHEIDRFIAAVRDAGVQLIGLNFFAGDLAGADCGVLSIRRGRGNSATTLLSPWASARPLACPP